MPTLKEKSELGQNKIGSLLSMGCVRVSDILAEEFGRWCDRGGKAGVGTGTRGTLGGRDESSSRHAIICFIEKNNTGRYE